MRALALVLLALTCAVACGKSEGDGPASSAGASATAGVATGGSSSAGAAGAAGTLSASGTGSTGGHGAAEAGAASGGAELGGAAQGGSSQSGSSAGGAAGQPEPAGGALGAGGASALVDCDQRKILCKRATPNCAEGEVPSVEGTCYGDCVKIESCACAAAEQCPRPEQYTCWMQQHCGPFVR